MRRGIRLKDRNAFIKLLEQFAKREVFDTQSGIDISMRLAKKYGVQGIAEDIIKKVKD
jgi:hypothetical protein